MEEVSGVESEESSEAKFDQFIRDMVLGVVSYS
jgi:hypothetical protein